MGYGLHAVAPRPEHNDTARCITTEVIAIANFVAMSLGEPPLWVVYSPLLPLFLLLFSGLYLFALPYATSWRRGQRTGGQE
ncbi:hypothetical protein [Neorhizobium galegae]|uniref:hypothetical protein n=1 Tax=Neorhizobium galegae TaxID=399 RepID=UPI003AF04C82